MLRKWGTPDVKWVVDDLFGAAGGTIKKATIKGLLYTSVANGGFGLFAQETTNKYDWKQSEERENKDRPVVYTKMRPGIPSANASRWWTGVRGLLESLLDGGKVEKSLNVVERASYKKAEWLSMPPITLLGDELPTVNRPINLQPVKIDKNQELFDKQLVIEALDYKNYTGWVQLDVKLRYWYNKCTSRAWTEVKKAGGFVTPQLNPAFNLYLGEALAPLAYPSLARVIASNTQRSKVSMETIYRTNLIAEIYLTSAARRGGLTP
jgi:hypothetical protein